MLQRRHELAKSLGLFGGEDSILTWPLAEAVPMHDGDGEVIIAGFWPPASYKGWRDAS